MDELIHLENEVLRASFACRGAELKSLYSIKSNTEYIWQGDPTYWAKSSPVLFPIVGSLIENTYYYNGHKYHLPRHGFAREMNFRVISSSKDQVQFLLTSDEATSLMYPFDFRLKIIYFLEASGITCKYEVDNPDQEKDLLFSIGAHPAFRVPFSSGTYSDYYLEFEEPDQLRHYPLELGLISKRTKNLDSEHGRIKLSHELFYDDALVFKYLNANKVVIKNNLNSSALEMVFPDFPYFGIWAARDAPFVCLEPWCGIADHVGHNQQIEYKEGIIRLKPKDSWTRSWGIRIL